MVIVPADRRRDSSGFAPAERAIFAYRLGAGWPDYHGDPLAIEARYETALAGQDPDTIRAWLRRDNLTVRLLGLRRLLPIVRAAFGLPAFVEGRPLGLSAAESMQLLRRFFAYQDRLQARWRREAELVVTYGSFSGRPHTFEREVGLWLNRARAQAFAGVAHWHGAIAASGIAPVPYPLVDALAATETQAHDLAAVIENNRSQAEAEAARRR